MYKAIKASMNNGLSGVLNAAFPNIIPVNKYKLPSLIINPKAGFVEGCFLVSILPSKTTRLKVTVQLFFKVCQDNRDEELMRKLVEF